MVSIFSCNYNMSKFNLKTITKLSDVKYFTQAEKEYILTKRLFPHIDTYMQNRCISLGDLDVGTLYMVYLEHLNSIIYHFQGLDLFLLDKQKLNFIHAFEDKDRSIIRDMLLKKQAQANEIKIDIFKEELKRLKVKDKIVCNILGLTYIPKNIKDLDDEKLKKYQEEVDMKEDWLEEKKEGKNIRFEKFRKDLLLFLDPMNNPILYIILLLILILSVFKIQIHFQF